MKQRMFASIVPVALAASALAVLEPALADQGQGHAAATKPEAAAHGHGAAGPAAAGGDHGRGGTAPAGDDRGHARASTGSGSPIDAAALYHDYCSVCHGDRGDGDSRAKGSMVPPPRDFTAPEARDLSRATMIAVVTKGKADTAMAPWETQLSADQIAAVVDYVRQTFIAPPDADAADDGARVYARTCSVCHGDKGSGAVWATSSLNPRPRDFTTTAAATELSRKRMIQSVTYGRPDTAMPGFGTQLDEREIGAVVDFVRSRFMRSAAVAGGAPAVVTAGHGHGGEPAGRAGAGEPSEGTAQGHDHDAHVGSPDALAEPFAGGLVGNLARGEELYRDNCVACHGEQGNGQGPRAYFILPKPRNFTHPASRSAFNRPHLFEAIARGRVGSEMAAWDTVLDEQAIADIAEYVFQRFILGETVGTASAVSARR